MRTFPAPLQKLLLLLLFFQIGNATAQVVFTPVEGSSSNTTRIDVQTSNFNEILSFQFSMNWDPNALSLDSITNLGVPGMGSSSFGVSFTHLGILTTSWFDFFLAGKTLPDGATLFSLWFTENNDSIPSCFSITNTPTKIEVTKKNNDVLDVSTTPLCFNLRGVPASFSVYHDLDDNCQKDPGEPTLNAWGVSLQKANRAYQFSTGSDGHIISLLDTGNYQLQVQAPNPYWESCIQSYDLTLDTATLDTMIIDIPAHPVVDCPYLQIDVSTPVLLACAYNKYNVNWCNSGTAAAENSYADITLSPNMSIQTSSIPAEDLGNGLYRFHLGNLPADTCGLFNFIVQLDLDCLLGAGVSHCVEAEIFPHIPCFPVNPDWDESFITLNGTCIGNDEIQFTIANEGSGNMSTTHTYVVFLDGLFRASGNYQLAAGETLTLHFPLEGAAWQIQTTQSVGYPWPSSPSFGLESCAVANGAEPSGLLPSVAEDDDAPHRSVDCRVSRNTASLNKKQGFPLGEGPQKLIASNQTLEYEITFQNITNQLVSNVTILDSISQQFDISTFRPGAASHPYKWSLQPGGILKFSFENIQLPDSSSNPILSQGFVRFSISPKSDLTPGTTLQNKATILIGTQTAKVTNTTFHSLRKTRVFNHQEIELCAGDSLSGIAFSAPDTLIEFTSNATTESYLISAIDILPVSFTEFDTLLAPGTLYNGLTYLSDTSITEKYVAANGCDSIVTVNIVVMVDNIKAVKGEKLQLKIGPNPAYNNIYIDWESKNQTAVSWQLFTPQGQIVLSQQANDLSNNYSGREEINISQLPAGMYVLTIQTGNSRKSFRIMKAKP